jgi:hypothetical protein
VACGYVHKMAGAGPVDRGHRGAVAGFSSSGVLVRQWR